MSFHAIFSFSRAGQALACVLAFQLAGLPAAGQTLPTKLNLVTVKGDGATGRVRQRAAQDPVVLVTDEAEKPVNGAAVVFTLPTEGPTGLFANGAKTFTILTNAEGIAVAQGLRFNQIPGKVPVHVNVSYRGLTARSNITQLVEAPAGYRAREGGGSGKVIAILAVIAAGGAFGAYYALRNTDSTPPATPSAVPAAIGITPGTGVLTPPR